MQLPVGRCALAASRHGLLSVTRLAESVAPPRVVGAEPNREALAIIQQAEQQLSEYFSGQRTEFSLPLDVAGLTEFQRRVLWQCARVPYGQTASYQDMARAAGSPGAARAVGQVMARNPMFIVVPCHRILGADGRLTGYGGGLQMKSRLLEMEHARRGWAAQS